MKLLCGRLFRSSFLLNDAHSKAEKEVSHEHGQPLQNHELKQRTDRDRFLSETENERCMEKKQETAEQFREAAKDITKERASERFCEASQDRTWQQALELAAEQEANRDLEQERDLTNDPDRQKWKRL